MKRRTLLSGFGLGGVVFAAAPVLRAAGTTDESRATADLQAQWRSFLPPGMTPDVSRAPVRRTPSEWRKLLTPEQFHVLREEGTERAGTSPLNAEKRAGIYVCAGCALPLFTSAMKYDSGTGWPSFFTTIPEVFGTKRDFALLIPRTEYHCIRCGGHHGHVFEDGPRPTGLRYCNNGLALRFISRG